MDLYQLQTEVSEWAARNFPSAMPHQPLLGAAEEIGELSHAHLKMEQGIRTNEDHMLGKVDAIGDVVIFLAHYCHLNGLNLGSCIYNTWEKVKQRDWTTKKSDGVTA